MADDIKHEVNKAVNNAAGNKPLSGVAVGVKGVSQTASAITGIVNAGTNEDGLENGAKGASQGATAQGYELLRLQRKKKHKEQALEKARKKAELAAKFEENAKQESSSAVKTSPRQNKTAGKPKRSVKKIDNKRADFSRQSASRQAYEAREASRAERLRRADAVKRLVTEKKAKEAARTAASESVKAALEKFAEGSVAAGGKYTLIALLVVAVVAVVVGIIGAVVALILGMEMSTRYNLIGDWYDSNLYATENFVAITQDLQRKYYDDCIALAYEDGADTPKTSDVKINWKEVYSLWSVIVRYRSDNAKMSIYVNDGYGNMVTGYEKATPVFNLTSAKNDMFSSGDDYLQDFYLAFYSMYYDLKAADERGNPILVKQSTGERFVPYYPEKSDGTGYEYSNFSAKNGWPLINTKTDTVVKNVLTRDPATATWSIKDNSYKFIYATDHVGLEEGCFDRGKPKVTVSISSKEDAASKVSYNDTKLKYPNPTAVDGLDALHEVYRKVYCNGYYYTTHYGPFNLGQSRVVSSDTIIEAGTSTSSKHEGILVVLDQIFDRSEYYPWGSTSAYKRGGTGLPGKGSGSHDYYDNIKRTLNLIRGSQSANYPSELPANYYLVADFDKSGTKINTFAVNNSDSKKTKWNSMIEMFHASVKEAQHCFPFYVQYKPYTGVGELNAGSDWEKGNLSGSISDCKCWDVLNFSWGNVQATWNSTTYLLYRYFMAEQGMSPAAACGILGSLQYETGFTEYNYVPPVDNNGAYALGLLQWNQGVKPTAGNANLYDNRLCSWCAEHNMNWKNAGAQLQYLSACCSEGDPAGTGDYPSGIYACQKLSNTHNKRFIANDSIRDSSYINSSGNPTFSAFDLAGAYEACYYWGVRVERSVEAIGGTYNDKWIRSGYGDSTRIFGNEPFIAYNKNNKSSKKYSYNSNWTGSNTDKQRYAAAHVFLRYVSASDPNFYSIASFDENT